METAVLQPINEAPFDNENSKGNSPVIDNKYFAFQAEHQTDPFEEDHHSESSKQNSTSNQDNHDIQDLERENFQETLAMPYENDPKPIQEEEDSLEQPSSSKSEDSSDQKHLDAPLQCISEDEVKKMEYFFQNDVPLEKNNVEEAVNSYWEKQLEEVKEMYEKKIQALMQNPKGVSGDSNQQLEKAIEQKYQQLYVQKINEMQETLKEIEEQNLAKIIEEVRHEFELDYEEKLLNSEKRIREESMRHLQSYVKEIEETQGRSLSGLVLPGDSRKDDHESDVFNKDLEQLMRSKIEAEYKAKFEAEKDELVRRFSAEQAKQQKKISTMEERLKEKFQKEMEEEMKKNIAKRERLLQLNFKKRLDEHKKQIEDTYNQEWQAKIDAERKQIEDERNEIARMKSLENVRLKKSEDARKALEQKMQEQEESYSKVIRDLQNQVAQLQQQLQKSTNENANPNHESSKRPKEALRREEGDEDNQSNASSLKEQAKSTSRSQKSSHSNVPPKSKWLNKEQNQPKLPPKKTEEKKPELGLKNRSSQVRSSKDLAKAYGLRECEDENDDQEQQYVEEEYKPSLSKIIGFQQSDTANFDREDRIRPHREDYGEEEVDENEYDPEFMEILDPLAPPSYLAGERAQQTKDSRQKEGPITSILNQNLRASMSQLQSSPQNKKEFTILKPYDSRGLAESLMQKYSLGAETKDERNEETPAFQRLMRDKGQFNFERERIVNPDENNSLEWTASRISDREDTEKGDPDVNIEKKSEVLKQKYMNEFSKRYNEVLKKYSQKTPSLQESFSQPSETKSWGAPPQEKHSTSIRKEDYTQIVDKYLEKKKTSPRNQKTSISIQQGRNTVKHLNAYEKIFEINETDDTMVTYKHFEAERLISHKNLQTKSMKSFKKSIEEKLDNDDALQMALDSKKYYITTEFVKKASILTRDEQQNFKLAIEKLCRMWDAVGYSCAEAIRFLENLEMISEYDRLMMKINLEMDYLQMNHRDFLPLVEILIRRSELRKTIDKENFSYKNEKKTYIALQGNTMELRRQFEKLSRAGKKEIMYKGVEIVDIIKIDSWEHDYLQKEDLRQELFDKIRKKF